MNPPDPIIPTPPAAARGSGSPFLAAAGFVTPRPPRKPAPDTIDTQIRDSGARVALHREQAIITMQEGLQHSIVSMSHELRADIAGVKDRVNDLADAVERIEQKVKNQEPAP